MQRRLAQAQHRDVGDLARLAQAGIGDVADQERIEPLAHRAMHVLQHLAGLQVLQIAELIADAADLGDAGDVDLGVRVAHLVEDAAQHARIAAPLGLAGHALIPELHARSSVTRQAGPPVEAAGKPTPQLDQRGARRRRWRRCWRLPSGPPSGRTLTWPPVACTPGAAAASVPARRHSDTIAAGVSCGSTSPNSSCAAAAVAHHASYSGPPGCVAGAHREQLRPNAARRGMPDRAPPCRASSMRAQCEQRLRASRGERRELLGHAMTAQQHRVHGSLARRRLRRAAGSARPNTGSMRAPSRWMPSNAAQIEARRAGGGDAGAAVRCQHRSAGRRRSRAWRRPSPAPSGRRRTARGGRPPSRRARPGPAPAARSARRARRAPRTGWRR